MNLKGLDEITYAKVNLLSNKRFKGLITSYDIMRWLTNFKIEEYPTALKVLEYLEVFTDAELVDLWQVRLEELLNQTNSNSKVILHPISDYGKSATLMIYYIKKTPAFEKNKNRIEFISSAHQFKKKKNGFSIKSALVLLDDFLGTGNSLIGYYKTYIKPQIGNTERISDLYCVSLFTLHKGKNNLSSKAPELSLISEVRNPAFATRGSVFGSRYNMLKYRDFCFNYGKGLFELEDYKGIKIDHPLGYENSQALLVFPYNPPNNTLPIIWSSIRDWIPLFPRHANYKISEARQKRKELAYYLSLLKHSPDFVLATGERDLGWTTINFITQTDFKTFAIVFMTRQRRVKPTICQILGITEADYDLCIQDAFTRGFVDAKGKLTEYGESLYEAVLIQLRRERKLFNNAKNVFDIKKINYLPTQFKGESLIN